MSKELSKEEINHRLIRLRNLERLHLEQGRRVDLLEEQVGLLKKENGLLREINAKLEAVNQDFQLQLEELRTMVFGKKKEKREYDDDFAPPRKKIERTSESYRRPIPKEEEVTEIKSHPIDTCAECHSILGRKRTMVFFEEDIPIPTKKIVRKHIVQKGYCRVCQKWKVAISLPAHKVILGPNIQKYICYLSVVCRLSYQQTQNILKDSYNIEISQGEIAKILNREAISFRPEYEQLKEQIRAEPIIHLDESGWKILCGGDRTFGWVMSGGESKKSVFLLGESRGKGNVETLRGKEYQGVTVTDDFNVYKKIPNHQLCWAHLLRKFRDLAQSDELSNEQRAYCLEQYKTISQIFSDVENDRSESSREVYTKRLEDLSEINPNDCKKLIRIKTTLQQNIPKYLTCLSHSNIPLTNNQAERSLRHLVLKRKISFGSWTKRAANNLAILLSVLMSRKQQNPDTWFQEWVGV